MFWIGFILPLLLVYLVPSILISWYFLTLDKTLSLSELSAPVIFLLVLAPASLALSWKFFNIGITGYTDCMLLAFLCGCSLFLYYVLIKITGNKVSGYLILTVSSFALVALVSFT